MIAMFPPLVRSTRLIGTSDAMVTVRRRIEIAGRTRLPVLLSGESGCGKEVVAREIHALRNPGLRFEAVNCATILPALADSALFGHERGAFTGAEARHPGHFGLVGHGTLFLDEVADLPSPVQAKLLRALELHEFRRVGGTEDVSFEGTVIAATNADLRSLVRKGKFREDLLYRLDGLRIPIPPLRAHPSDIPLIIAWLLGLEDLAQLPFSDGAMRALQAAPWRGNVRELRQTVDYLVAMANGGIVDEAAVLAELAARAEASPSVDPDEAMQRAAAIALDAPGERHFLRTELAMLREAVRRAGGKTGKAAKLAGWDRQRFERKLRKLSAETRIETGEPDEDPEEGED